MARRGLALHGAFNAKVLLLAVAGEAREYRYVIHGLGSSLRGERGRGITCYHARPKPPPKTPPARRNNTRDEHSIREQQQTHNCQQQHNNCHTTMTPPPPLA